MKFADTHEYAALTDTQFYAYAKRVGLALPIDTCSPNLPTLRAITYAHACTIPFESSQIRLLRHHSRPTAPLALSSAAAFDQLVRAGRGGYCYFHGILLAAALRHLGYSVYLGTGAICEWNAADAAFDICQSDHMVVFVHCENKLFVVEMGNHRCSFPIEVTPGATVIAAAGETYQLRVSNIAGEDNFLLCHKWAPWVLEKTMPHGVDPENDLFLPVVHFSKKRFRPADFNALNYCLNYCPDHKLQRYLIVSKVTETFGRAVLVDLTFKRRETPEHGHLERVVHITTLHELLNILKVEFGIEWSQDEVAAAQSIFFSSIK
ncbi:hypothetical protein HDU83_006409 [Entophlyctis luteolus]|nr:hypothetical protein HDU83_006409 [Entophlyctis luteolus]KAJ3380367.1 hypothetical protein HDU84_005962 [Entophlyctis sp. JEL0112]